MGQYNLVLLLRVSYILYWFLSTNVIARNIFYTYLEIITSVRTIIEINQQTFNHEYKLVQAPSFLPYLDYAMFITPHSSMGTLRQYIAY